MATATLGTANLFGLLDRRQSYDLLITALDAGFVAFDTAPSYGHGDSELELGRLVAGRDDVLITTKVGLDPVAAPTAPVRAAKAVARRLPPSLQAKLRRGGAELPPGRFAPRAVRESVERSLRRLGRVDRLLLHEVTPQELTDELLVELDRLRDTGSVGSVGVATSNEMTPACLARAPHLLTTANVSVAAQAPTVTAEDRIGHGVFGAGGRNLVVAQERLQSDTALAARWQAAASGTRFGGLGGFGDAMLAHASAGLDGVIIATSRPEQLARRRDLVEDGASPSPELEAILGQVCAVQPVPVRS